MVRKGTGSKNYVNTSHDEHFEHTSAVDLSHLTKNGTAIAVDSSQLSYGLGQTAEGLGQSELAGKLKKDGDD